MPKRKLRKVVAVGLALFMTAGVDNGWAIGNIAKGITVQAKSIAKAEEEKRKIQPTFWNTTIKSSQILEHVILCRFHEIKIFQMDMVLMLQLWISRIQQTISNS